MTRTMLKTNKNIDEFISDFEQHNYNDFEEMHKMNIFQKAGLLSVVRKLIISFVNDEGIRKIDFHLTCDIKNKIHLVVRTAYAARKMKKYEPDINALFTSLNINTPKTLIIPVNAP